MKNQEFSERPVENLSLPMLEMLAELSSQEKTASFESVEKLSEDFLRLLESDERVIVGLSNEEIKSLLN